MLATAPLTQLFCFHLILMHKVKCPSWNHVIKKPKVSHKGLCSQYRELLLPPCTSHSRKGFGYLTAGKVDHLLLHVDVCLKDSMSPIQEINVSVTWGCCFMQGITTYDYILAVREQNQESWEENQGLDSLTTSPATSTDTGFSGYNSSTGVPPVKRTVFCTPPRLFVDQDQV